MATTEYDYGDAVRCSGSFTDASSVAVDPAAVFFQSKNPSGNITTLEYGVDAAVVKASVGHYYVDVNGNTPGFWFYRFYSTGSGQAADEDTFLIRSSEFD
jgi:hypothetical protein